MPKLKNQSSSEPAKKMRPALTPEARENQLIALAVDLAEKQLREGTASAQVIGGNDSSIREKEPRGRNKAQRSKNQSFRVC